MTEAEKATIDGMTQLELCRRWRFSKAGDPLFQGETGDYFKRVLFEERGGFTPAISKAIGLGEGR